MTPELTLDVGQIQNLFLTPFLYKHYSMPMYLAYIETILISALQFMLDLAERNCSFGVIAEMPSIEKFILKLFQNSFL